MVVAWLVVLAVLIVWSVRHDPPTVPEQRTIAQAMPELQRAVGVTLAAAGGPGRAVLLDDLEFATDCRITPVRAGVNATRDVRVYLAAGRARAVLDAIAAALPASYRASVVATRGGTELSMHADAGSFIGIDASASAETTVLALRVSTDCRPPGSDPDRRDPTPGAAPPAWAAVLSALGVTAPPEPGTSSPATSGPGTTGPATSGPGTASPGIPGVGGASPGDPSAAGPVESGPSAGGPGPAGSGSAARVQAVACPAGGIAGTWTLDGVAAPAGLAGRLARWATASGAETVRSDDSVRAYRVGGASVVVLPVTRQRLQVAVTTTC